VGLLFPKPGIIRLYLNHSDFSQARVSFLTQWIQEENKGIFILPHCGGNSSKSKMLAFLLLPLFLQVPEKHGGQQAPGNSKAEAHNSSETSNIALKV
jgi:hypothetical protein